MTKDQLREELDRMLDLLIKAPDFITISVTAGVDEVKPVDGFKQFKPNDTLTISILVNGGAADRHRL